MLRVVGTHLRNNCIDDAAENAERRQIDLADSGIKLTFSASKAITATTVKIFSLTINTFETSSKKKKKL